MPFKTGFLGNPPDLLENVGLGLVFKKILCKRKCLSKHGIRVPLPIYSKMLFWAGFLKGFCVKENARRNIVFGSPSRFTRKCCFELFL